MTRVDCIFFEFVYIGTTNIKIVSIKYKLIYCSFYSNGVGSQALATLVTCTTLPLNKSCFKNEIPNSIDFNDL